MLVPWFNYNACSITRDSQGKRVQFARQHVKVRDFTSRQACLEVKFYFYLKKKLFNYYYLKIFKHGSLSALKKRK